MPSRPGNPRKNSPALSAAPEPGVGVDAHALDFGLRHAIAVAEVIVCVLERRSGFEVERRERLHARELWRVLLVLPDAALAFRDVAREEDHDGVEIGTRQTAHPVVRMVRAGISQDRRARGHALSELLGKCRQRRVVHAQARVDHSR